jgi:hypothetical protein
LKGWAIFKGDYCQRLARLARRDWRARRKQAKTGEAKDLLCFPSKVLKSQRPIMKTPLKLLPLLLLLALPAAVQAQFNYTTNNGTITITGYTGSGGAVTIPDKINGLPVTSIGSYAFQNSISLTSVTIGNSVTNIGESAFDDCISLTSVTIPNSVTSIRFRAFYYCTSLTSVTIPNSVTSIGDYAFSSCGGLTSVMIPNSVTNIGSYTFQGCPRLTSVTIGNSVTGIGNYAFYYCYSLTSVTIPNSVTNIGSYAFYKCYKLTSVTIGNRVTSIGNYTFQYCPSLTSVTIPNSVTSIGDWAFSYCPSLTSVMIPGSVTNIGSGAFNGGTSLSAITVDALNSVYSSVAGVLFNKSQTTLIQCPGGKAGTYTIANTVTSIGDRAFDSCHSLTSITIGNSVTNIGNFAFSSCTNLTSVTIGNSVTSIGSDAFYYCSSLTSVTIPNSVTNLGSGAFYGCSNLTSVTIPNRVTSLGDYTFYGCGSLTGVYFQGNAPSLGLSVFDGDTNAIVYYLPGTTGWGVLGTPFGGRPTFQILTIPILTIPGITITGSFPPGPVTNGSLVAFGGSVCNTGNITLTNIFVFSGQPSNTLVLGPITLAPGACAPFTGSYLATGGCNLLTNSTIVTNSRVIITPTNTVTITPTNTVAITPTNTVAITPTNTVTVTPTNTVTVTTTNTVTVTTNTVTPTFGTIDPLTGILTDRFNVPSNLHGLMYADQNENWGPTLFYSTRHPASGADTFDTISTVNAPAYAGSQYVGFVTNEFDLTETNYDALTLAAPNVGYGEINFYYIRHDNSGVSTFGQIISQGASSSADLWPILNTGYTGLAFAAANVGYGANMFYYVRNDTNGLSWFGTINPTPGGIATDLYPVGINFDALVYVDLAPIPGWGTDYFAYLRHDNIGSIIGTIDPMTHVATDRVHLGTNFLTGLTFTATDVGYGPYLFYYLRPAGSALTTNTVSGFVTNTVSGFATNTVSGFATNTVSGFVTNTVTGFVTNTVTGFVTNTVTTDTTNCVVSFTPTNTVTATGMDIYQARTVVAAANCIESVAPAPLVPVIGAPTMVNGIFSLSFPTEIGKSYTVQYKNTFTDPVWTDLPNMSVSGTGGYLSIMDASAAQQPSRFYRVTSP